MFDLIEQLEQEVEEDRHAERVESCGRYFRVVVHLKRTAMPMLCGDRLNCERCREIFIQEEVERLERAIQDGEVRIYNARDHADACRISRYCAGDTRKYPLQDGRVVVLMRTTQDIGKKVEKLDDVDWETISRTPRGKRVSGTLGSRKPVVQKNTLELKAGLFKMDVNYRQLEEGDKIVAQKLRHERIDTLERAQEVVNNVIERYRETFADKIVSFSYIKIRVRDLSFENFLSFVDGRSPPN